MREWYLPVGVLLLGLISAAIAIAHTIDEMTLVSATPVVQEAVPEACVVSAAYKEAVDENIINLRKMYEASYLTDSPLDNPEFAGIQFALMSSSRRYHEQIHDELPACAQPMNTSYIAALTATQDVIGMKLGQAANPEIGRYEDRFEQARSHLDEQWVDFMRVWRETDLQVIEG